MVFVFCGPRVGVVPAVCFYFCFAFLCHCATTVGCKTPLHVFCCFIGEWWHDFYRVVQDAFRPLVVEMDKFLEYQNGEKQGLHFACLGCIRRLNGMLLCSFAAMRRKLGMLERAGYDWQHVGDGSVVSLFDINPPSRKKLKT